MDGIVDMNKQEIKEFIDSSVRQIRKVCFASGSSKIKQVILEIEQGKFFDTKFGPIKIISLPEAGEFDSDYQTIRICISNSNVYIEFSACISDYSNNWAQWLACNGYQVTPKEIKITIYERIEY